MLEIVYLYLLVLYVQMYLFIDISQTFTKVYKSSLAAAWNKSVEFLNYILMEIIQ